MARPECDVCAAKGNPLPTYQRINETHKVYLCEKHTEQILGRFSELLAEGK